MMKDPPVEQISSRAYRIPTDGPEADGTLAWASTTVVVVEATAANLTGIGYTYASQACVPLLDNVLAEAVTGRSVLGVNGCWLAMVRAVRNIGRSGIASCAISAVDMALWDLKAQLLDVPLVDLLGAVRTRVPAYGSGGFTTYRDAQAREQLLRWTGEWGMSRVKIKIGEGRGRDEERDLRRTAFARTVIGPEAQLFVDANGAYSRKQAVRMGHALADLGVTWFEEPVTSDDLAGLAHVRMSVSEDVAAGEYGYDLASFDRMVKADAVDCLQIDVTRCGGYSEWMRVAALAAAQNLEISAHCAPLAHLPVAATAPHLRHIEYFHDHVRIESLLFAGAPSPVDGALTPIRSGPGRGWRLKEADAEPFRIC